MAAQWFGAGHAFRTCSGSTSYWRKMSQLLPRNPTKQPNILSFQNAVRSGWLEGKAFPSPWQVGTGRNAAEAVCCAVLVTPALWEQSWLCWRLWGSERVSFNSSLRVVSTFKDPLFSQKEHCLIFWGGIFHLFSLGSLFFLSYSHRRKK